MELTFTVSARISKPVHAVFEAVADPAQLSRYFTTGGAEGRLEAGATVTWDFHDFPGAFPVEVVAVEPDQKIVFRWKGAEAEGTDSKTTVTMLFEAAGPDRTLVTISEAAWRPTDAGLKASYSNCMGWSQMLCALRVWIEHGINLREGMYK